MFKVAMDYFFYLRKSQWEQKHIIEGNSWKKIHDNIKYAYEHVPFYKEQFRKAGITPDDITSIRDMYKIPLTTKQKILQSNLSYVSDEFASDDLYTSRTSGSTGEPFVSYFDKRGWSILKFASKYRARKACGFSIIEKFVVIEAMPVNEAEKHNDSYNISNLLIRKKFLSIYDTLDNHIEFYQKFQPTTIYGFPSYFVKLVEYLEKNNIRLDFVKRIFTSSEILNTTTRKLIEEYFNCELHDIYGSTEIKEVSWECKTHEGYHINEDLVYVECIDENGMPVEDGVEGRIVMTSLENKAMPLLRYSIGDTGVILKHKCSCGRNFRLMKPMYGRTIDYFILKDGKKISPYELTMSMEDIPGILQYQILQKTISLVEINLRVNEAFKQSSSSQIIYNLKKILGSDSDIILNFVEQFGTEGARGKFRIVKSEVKNEI